MKTYDFSKIINQINSAEKISLFTHIRPDGDAVGSVLALRLILLKLGKSVSLFIDDVPTPEFLILKGIESINASLPEKTDLAISVDCAEMDRMGNSQSIYKSAKTKINIDHHKTNPRYADYNLIDADASATAEIITALADALDPDILDKDIATNLYVALITDCGNFSYSNTTKNTFLCAARLTEKDIDLSYLNRMFFKNMKREKFEFLKRALNSIRFYADGKVALIIYTVKDVAECKATSFSSDGLIDYALNVEGVEVAISMKEHSENCFKISFRSKEYANVAQAASVFGGGGHAAAAGCMVKGPLEEVAERVVKAACDQLKF